MRTINDSARAFIDLAKLGRTSLWAIALTLLLISFINTISAFGILAFSPADVQSAFYRKLSVINLLESLFTGAAGIGGIAGFWLACRFILRRPYVSIVSAGLKFSVPRVLLGMALFLPALVVSVIASSVYFWVRFGTWQPPLGGFNSNPHVFGFGPILSLFAGPVAIGVFAFGEEQFFRGWLTQTLGQFIRVPAVVVTVVAVSFAIYHTQYDLPVKAAVFFHSIGFSVLSLRDQRLELALGAHTMLNTCVALLIPTFFVSAHPHVNLPNAIYMSHTILILDIIVFALIRGALPFALMYWFLQKTNGWFEPKPATEVADVQPA
ncbi:CPBP family glutamic-type intramembrane protease (plasmid) [Paraburkholderia sp. PREW-6R]|uniref:CPBP family glutamic-type intramembrane protease n=1 Tax=Paraburkholderia sp. PREW-6R TaxID=3141544 RepID=UPI0031F4E938